MAFAAVATMRIAPKSTSRASRAIARSETWMVTAGNHGDDHHGSPPAAALEAVLLAGLQIGARPPTSLLTTAADPCHRASASRGRVAGPERLRLEPVAGRVRL